VFGFSFGELVVLMIVAVVVIGPKDLPKVLRRAGQWASKLRRMASDIRTQSGIDDVLRGEGIAEDIAEIRKLARGEMADVTRAARVDVLGPLRNEIVRSEPQRAPQTDAYAAPPPDEILIHRDREYPREGADARGALPDTALVYASSFPASSLARDPLYVMGDPGGVIPPEEPEPAADAAPHEESAPEQPQHDA
jgi:sec-independent protein translocase protein TatB